MTLHSRIALALPLVLFMASCSKNDTPTTPSTTTTTTTTTTNRAPVLTSVSVSPTTGISGLTNISMSASATDADGDALTYSWNFGGAAAAGASVSTKINGDGLITVQVTVSDGKGGTATDSRTVTIGTLTGSWTLVAGVCGTDPREQAAVLTLTQTGTSITGSASFPGYWCNVGPGTHAEIPPSTPGTIDDQGNFNLPRLAIGSFLDIRLQGKIDIVGRKATGQTFNSGFTGEAFTMVKK